MVIPKPGARVAMPARGVAPSLPCAIMCSERMAAPAEVPPTHTPRALRRRIDLATGVPPSTVEMRSWFPPVRKTPVARSSASSQSTRCASSRVR
ncbi:MAG: hypothetical protein M5U28_50115 [Sandaracinaceae bacterium]|nr:hypothetical protein [Sandaracinaceae bacterium]